MVEQRTPSQKPNQLAAVLPFSGPFSEKAIAKLRRLESTQRSQADITAEDTVIRYGQQSADRFQAEPMGHPRGVKPGRPPELCATLKLFACFHNRLHYQLATAVEHSDYHRFLVPVHADILDVATHAVASLRERSFALNGVFPSR
jgi:hypothetical protein